jgi:hypothetical protein
MPRFKVWPFLRGQQLACRRHESRVHCYRAKEHYLLRRQVRHRACPRGSSDSEHYAAELFRNWLKVIVGRIRARKYRALMNKLRYADAGRKFTRDEMNER